MLTICSKGISNFKSYVLGFLTRSNIDFPKEPGGVLVFLPGQDDIEALQSLLEENLPDIVGQQYEDPNMEEGSVIQSECKERDSEESSVYKHESDRIIVKKGILKDFEILPLYAAMPPDEQVKY